MAEHPTISAVMEAVCSEINSASPSLYNEEIRKTIPMTAEDVLMEPSKYRTHSDARVIAAIIMRKHVRLPFSFDELRCPTYSYLKQHLKTGGSGHGLPHRMVVMCEVMREKPAYRGCYVRAVRSLQAQGFALWMTDNIETTAPCQ